ncbi:MAG: prenyltransferase/squalene oxidase repeat-containing protein [Spirochaetia bacterium]
MNPLIPLLASSSPCLRCRVLRELTRPDPEDPELQELEKLRGGDPLLLEILNVQNDDGSFSPADPARQAWGDPVLITAHLLTRLSLLGFGPEFEPAQRGAEFIFSRQRKDGSWPLGRKAGAADERGAYSTVPLQTALPLAGIAAAGFAQDPRAEKGYEWLLAQRLPEGAWPTGMAKGDYGRVAGYRRLPHTRHGCRSNTTGAVICFSLHPERRTSEPVRKGLDHLLGRETRDRGFLGFETARLLGYEPLGGFIAHFARFDPALILTLCARTGLVPEDARLRSLIDFIRTAEGSGGLWSYASAPGAEPWIALEIRSALQALEAGGSWIGEQPVTPFSPYPRKRRRW